MKVLRFINPVLYSLLWEIIIFPIRINNNIDDEEIDEIVIDEDQFD